MEHMKDIFPYHALSQSHTNSLLEPNELTRELLDGAEEFRARLGELTEEEREYARNDLRAALAYLTETNELLRRLENSLRATGLTEGARGSERAGQQGHDRQGGGAALHPPPAAMCASAASPSSAAPWPSPGRWCARTSAGCSSP